MPVTRDKLREVISAACDKACVNDQERERLVKTADDINQVLIGNFAANISGEFCGCPATLAGYWIPANEDDASTGTYEGGRWIEDTSLEVHDFPRFFDTSFTSNALRAAENPNIVLVDNSPDELEAERVLVVD